VIAPSHNSTETGGALSSSLSLSLDESLSMSLRKVIQSFNVETSTILSKIITNIPCTTAITYHIHELPYHMPPEIYKFTFLQNGNVRIAKRKKTWRSLSSSVGGAGFGGRSFSLSDTGNGDFLQYFLDNKMYPKVDFSVFSEEISHRDIFNLRNYGADIDWDNQGANLTVYEHKNTGGRFKRKKKSFLLNRSVKWLWTLNCDCELVFCPEKQLRSSDTRNEVKHGDMVASQRHIGSVDHIISGRGPARMGGEFYFDSKRGKWCINNDSSYCFFRQDKVILSNGRGFKWQNYIDMLFRAFGIDTSELRWIDKVQCRQLDGYIVQNVAFRYQRHRNKTLKQFALDQVSQLQKSEEFQIVKHFKDVNMADLFLGAFGADILFLTEGKLELNIIKGVNIPAASKILELEYPKRYCKIRLMGCERIIQDKWWNKVEQTQSIECKAEDTVFWHSPKYEFYVTSHQIEVIAVDVYQEPDIKLGSCFVDVRDLKANQSTTKWFPVVGVRGGVASNRKSGSHKKHFSSNLVKKGSSSRMSADGSNLIGPQIGMTLKFTPHCGTTSSTEPLTTSIILNPDNQESPPLQNLAFAKKRILERVAEYLDKKDEQSFRLTCKYWSEIACHHR